MVYETTRRATRIPKDGNFGGRARRVGRAFSRASAEGGRRRHRRRCRCRRPRRLRRPVRLRRRASRRHRRAAKDAMTVNAEIGNLVSPYCSRARCWRTTSADNIAVIRRVSGGLREDALTKGNK